MVQLFELVTTSDMGYSGFVSTGSDLVDEICFQRGIELWGEGVSWFDLKRSKLPLNSTGEGSNHIDFGS